MTTQCPALLLSATSFQLVPALPRRFRDPHFAAFLVRRSRLPQLRPSLWWRMRSLLSGLGLLLAVLVGVRPVA